MEVRGKKGRVVPIILTVDLKEGVEILEKHRGLVGIEVSNKNLFPAPFSSTGHYGADVVLRQLAKMSGVQQPATLTATQLRKHVTTMVRHSRFSTKADRTESGRLRETTTT